MRRFVSDESKPTSVIAQPLVIKHKSSYILWKLFALPQAFLTASVFAFGLAGRRLY